jgi:hypothetical protein
MRFYAATINQYLNDRTGLLMDMGFSYVGNCMCDNCNQKKYKNKEYLIKICDSRGKFNLYRNDQLIESKPLTEFINISQQYEFITITE